MSSESSNTFSKTISRTMKRAKQRGSLKLSCYLCRVSTGDRLFRLPQDLRQHLVCAHLMASDTIDLYGDEYPADGTDLRPASEEEIRRRKRDLTKSARLLYERQMQDAKDGIVSTSVNQTWALSKNRVIDRLSETEFERAKVSTQSSGGVQASRSAVSAPATGKATSSITRNAPSFSAGALSNSCDRNEGVVGLVSSTTTADEQESVNNAKYERIEEVEVFYCEVCNITFGSKEDLSSHEGELLHKDKQILKESYDAEEEDWRKSAVSKMQKLITGGDSDKLIGLKYLLEYQPVDLHVGVETRYVCSLCNVELKTGKEVKHVIFCHFMGLLHRCNYFVSLLCNNVSP